MISRISAIKKITKPLIHIFAYLILYTIIDYFSDKPAFPSLVLIFKAATTTVYRELLIHFPATLIRWFFVFVLGSFFGVLAGLILGYFYTLHSYLKADIDFFRSLPATALISFVMAAFGDNDAVRSFPAFYITFFTVLFYVAKNAKMLNSPRKRHLAELGASQWFIIRHCIFYELLPSTMIALRQAVSLSFLVLISVELIIGPAGNRGLGLIFYNWLFYTDYANILVGLTFLGIVGYILNILASVIQKKAIYWQEIET